MKTDSTIMEYEGLELDVRYEYDPPGKGDYYNPPIEGNLSIVEVYVKGEYVLHIMSNHIVERLEAILYDREISG